MKYLLDTDICVFWLRGQPAVRDQMQLVGAAGVAISVITLAELRYGASCSAQPVANHHAIDAFISGAQVIGVSAEIAAEFGARKAQLRQQGMLLEDFDLLIAATAQVYGLTLVTNNEKHFGRIAGLHVVNWV